MPTFLHSGNLGDIIYALPTIRALGGGTLYIAQDRTNRTSFKYPPRLMTSTQINQIIELLRKQSYLSSVKKYENESVDYDLDIWRASDLIEKDIVAAHLKSFRVSCDSKKAWLDNIKSKNIKNIVIHHSGRYQTSESDLDWNCLKEFQEQCLFLGSEEEHELFIRKTKLMIIRHSVASLIEFAEIIKGSKIFIGNQSLGYAIAEAMQHPRILQVYMKMPNCLPRTKNGYIRLTRKIIIKKLKNDASPDYFPGFSSKIFFLFYKLRGYFKKHLSFLK